MTTTAGTSAADFLPDRLELGRLKAAAERCQGCELFEDATQTVFGSGPGAARVVMIGEQPGDVEDQRGLPFVGPAGRLLRRALADVGIDPDDVYLTNAVKHFRFKIDDRGKRRLHEKPSARHINACRPWVQAELSALDPSIVVVLGATAAASVLGPGVKVTQLRGELRRFTNELEEIGSAQVLVTVHPSAILRSRERDRDYELFVQDLRVAATALE
ncbi:MAG: uracil-DNA glycosylase superfamily protein [Pseudonocardiales bacterium]|nr:uracil-DNA glycosylase superfamily protein [Pseudonocardiales bacterium]